MLLLALAAAATAAADDTVHAKFGWAPGDAWLVTFERTTSRTGSGAPRQETRTTARWTATVTGTPGALELRTSAYTLDAMTGFPPDDLSGAYTAAMLAAAPSFSIRPTVEVGELLDIAVARAPSDQVLEANTFLTPKARSEVRAMMPDAQLTALVADWWGSLVATWVDAELAKGEAVTTRMEVPVPVLGNLPVGMDLTFIYDGPTPCTSGAPASCEALGTRSTLDPTGLAVAIETYTHTITAAQGGSAGMRVDSLAMDTATRLVTEADDLRPRALVVERSTRMRGEADRQPFEVEQAETRSWTFTPVATK